MHCQLTALETGLLQELQHYFKGDLGRFNIKEFTTDEGFDKRRFGYKCKCGYCNRYLNPFDESSLQIKSEWAWSLDSKEAQKKYMVSCPNCKNELRFALYIIKE